MSEMFVGFGTQPGADGVRAFAEHYTNHTFVGRHKEFVALATWYESASKRLLIVAPAGLGKSALVTRWARELSQHAPVAWLPISVRFGTSSPSLVRDLLTARLVALGAKTTGDWVDAAASSDCVVVLDGLDEANDARLIDDLCELTNSNARVVVAARSLVDRDAQAWLQLLGWDDAHVVTLKPLTRSAVAELFDNPEHAAEAMRITGGDPLDLAFFLGDEQATMDTHGLLKDHDALCVGLACAVAPITPSLLARVAAVRTGGVQIANVTKAIHAAGRFIVKNPAGCVSWAHPRLAHTALARLDDDERSSYDQAFATVIRAEQSRLLAGGNIDENTPYIVAAARDHLIRAGASLDELDSLIDLGWLQVWESVERGASGFLADLFALWERVDAEQAKIWSDERATLQFRYAALAQFLDGSESALSAETRADAVRLGVRGQRAALASLAAVTKAWEHASAVRALLEVLDAHGFDRLLASVADRSSPRWPVAEIMARLIDLGLEDEALLWLRGREKCAVITLAVACLDRLSEGKRPIALEAIRRGLHELDATAAWMHTLVLGASVLPKDECKSWLVHGVALVADEDNLFWDAYEGDRDPRLELAEGFATVGDKSNALLFLERSRANPHPFTEEKTSSGPELAIAFATCGQALDDDELRARAIEFAGLSFSACLGLVQEGVLLPEELEPLIPKLGMEDAKLMLRAASIAPSAALAARTLELVTDCCEDLTQYGNGYALYAGLLNALGVLVHKLDAKLRCVALELVWDHIAVKGAPTVRWWHIMRAIIPLLSTSPNARIAQAVMDRASNNPTQRPPLCSIPAWREVWGETAQRAYLRKLLGVRRVARLRDWCALLGEFGEVTAGDVRATVGKTVVDLAMANKELTYAAEASGLLDEETWRRVVRFAELQSADGRSVAWSLASLLKSAPTEEDRQALARFAWSQPKQTSRMGCAGELLAALPENEAEPIADLLIEQNQLGFVSLRSLPPQAKARVLRERRAKLAPDDWIARTQLFKECRNVDGIDVSAERTAIVAYLLTEVFITNDTYFESMGWDVLAQMIPELELAELYPFENAISTRGSNELTYTFALRVQHLGDEALCQRMLRHVAHTGGVMAMNTLLIFVDELDELEPFFHDNPAFVAYTWVIEGIERRGWSDAYALRARKEGVRERLLIWHQLWDNLASENQRALWPEVIKTLEMDATHVGHVWWTRLSTAEQRSLWLRERSARNNRLMAQRPKLSHTPSEALGLATEHAQTLIETVRWFIPA